MSKFLMAENAVNPGTPSPGKRCLFPKSDGWYEEDSAGNIRKLEGEQGAQGIQGVAGNDGVDGDIGPVGPQGSAGATELIAIDTLTVPVTLPDTSTYSQVRNFLFNVSSSGQYVMQAVTGIRPHNASNDMRFEWDLNGSLLSPSDYYSEEHKDLTTQQSILRPHQFDLGTLSVGSNQLELYFRKESTGGTAQLKYLSIFIWKVS